MDGPLVPAVTSCEWGLVVPVQDRGGNTGSFCVPMRTADILTDVMWRKSCETGSGFFVK